MPEPPTSLPPRQLSTAEAAEQQACRSLLLTGARPSAIRGPTSWCATATTGRWGTDVMYVYQQALLRGQLDASRAMANADAADPEAAVAGGVQPAAFR